MRVWRYGEVAGKGGFMRVLLVELDPTKGDIFERAFQISGWEVFGARSGDSASSAYREVSPHAVLLDFGLRGEQGLDALRQLVDIDPGGPYVCTSAPGTASLDRALAIGARAVVATPYRLDDVLDAIQRVSVQR